MKNNIKKLLVVGLLLGSALFMHPASAHASSNFNDNYAGADLPTVRVMNHTQNPTCGSLCVWTSSVTANPGDVISVAVYYHNTGPDAALNTLIHLSPQTTNNGSSHTISGSVTASNAANTGSGSAVVYTTSATTLSFMNGGVYFYPDKQTSPSPIPSGQNGGEAFSGGLNIGTISAPQTCTGYPNITFCHQGYVIFRYSVAPVQQQQTPCVINSFSASPSSVTSGSSSTLSWSTSNCTSASISPFIGNITNPNSGSMSTGALANSTTFTLYASGNGASPQATTVVNVNSVSNPCSISYFNANPMNVNSGNSSTLSWNTPNCTSVTISPFVGNGLNPTGGSASTNSLYNDTTYTLYASGNGASPSQQVTVHVNGNNGQAPTATTNSATNITEDSAHLRGTVDPNGDATDIWFEWGVGTSMNHTTNTQSIGSGTSSQNVSYDLSNLSSGTTYSFRVCATNSFGDDCGSRLTFTTEDNGNCNCNNSQAPQVTTNNATNVGETYATLNGYIDTNGSSTNYYFQYGTNSNSLIYTTFSQTEYSSGNVSAYLANLSPNTTYYFRLYGSNNNGSDYGQVRSFTTSGQIINYGNLTVTTAVATNVGKTSARLNGVISNTANSAATIWFEYGTDQSVPFTTPSQTAGYGMYQAVSSFLSTLSPSTTYYYRVAGSLNGVVVRGALSIFTTAAPSSQVVYVNTNTGSGTSDNIMLKIETPFENVKAGDTVPFTVTYKNISGKTLKDAVLKVTFPSLISFSQSSTGIYDIVAKDLTVRLGTLDKNEEGTMNIITTALDPLGTNGSAVTTATMVFTLPSSAQDEAIAYAFNTVSPNSNLAGLALFGTGFFPNTLVGWIILILIIALIIALARRLYSTKPRPVPPPPTHFPTY